MNSVRRTIDRMTADDWALVDRACALTGATPRALLLVAANAAVQRQVAKNKVRDARQRELPGLKTGSEAR